jgi:hypothetical protein
MLQYLYNINTKYEGQSEAGVPLLSISLLG